MNPVVPLHFAVPDLPIPVGPNPIYCACTNGWSVILEFNVSGTSKELLRRSAVCQTYSKVTLGS